MGQDSGEDEVHCSWAGDRVADPAVPTTKRYRPDGPAGRPSNPVPCVLAPATATMAVEYLQSLLPPKYLCLVASLDRETRVPRLARTLLLTVRYPPRPWLLFLGLLTRYAPQHPRLAWSNQPPTPPFRLPRRKEYDHTPAVQYQWFASLLKQHGELEALLKEGRALPYVTVRDEVSFYKTLVTEVFQDTVMVENAAARQHTVIMHGAPLYMNVNLIETPMTSCGSNAGMPAFHLVRSFSGPHPN